MGLDHGVSGSGRAPASGDNDRCRSRNVAGPTSSPTDTSAPRDNESWYSLRSLQRKKEESDQLESFWKLFYWFIYWFRRFERSCNKFYGNLDGEINYRLVKEVSYFLWKISKSGCLWTILVYSCIREIYFLSFFSFFNREKIWSKRNFLCQKLFKREFFNVVLMLMIIFNNIFIKFLSRRKYI